MMGKLIKYDFRSCWKKFWPIWSALIILSAVNGLSLVYCERTGNFGFTVNALPKLLLGGAGMAAFVIAIIYVCDEFYHGLLGEPGYLMFTLPVKEEELIGSKAVTALILEIISGAVVVLCAILILSISYPEGLTEILNDIRTFLAECDNVPLAGAFVLEVLVFALCTAVTFNFHIYAGISLGHLAQKNRKIAAAAAFILLCILSVFLLTRVAVPLLNLIYDHDQPWNSTEWSAGTLTSMKETGVLIAGELVYTVLLFLVTRGILKKRLNLSAT